MKYDIKIDTSGNKRYYVNNVLHREDGPAVEYASGEKFWYNNGLLHREEGPASVLYGEFKYWYLNGKCYGVNDAFTDNSWKTFIKTLIFS